MPSFIQEIISKYPHRLAGTEEEWQAQKKFKKKLECLGLKSQLQSFQAPLYAWFGSLKLFSALAIIALITSYLSQTISMILAVMNSLIFSLHFLLRINLLGFLFKKYQSVNAFGELESQNKEKLTIFLGAHMDSTRECRWWYWLGNLGVWINKIGGFFILFMPAIIFLLQKNLPVNFPQLKLLFSLVIISPILTIYTFHNNKIIVNGVVDDLSGIEVILKIIQNLITKKSHKISLLKNIKLIPISFGAEESRRWGSTNFIKEYRSYFNQKSFLINFDGIFDYPYLALVRSDTLGLVKYSKDLISQFQAFTRNRGLNFKTINIKSGGTDAANFVQAGIPALNVIGVPVKKLAHCYHTRLDKLDQINWSLLEKVAELTSLFLIDLDNKLANQE